MKGHGRTCTGEERNIAALRNATQLIVLCPWDWKKKGSRRWGRPGAQREEGERGTVVVDRDHTTRGKEGIKKARGGSVFFQNRKKGDPTFTIDKS